MGNSMCCQEQTTKTDLKQITITQSSFGSIQSYLHENPTIEKILAQNAYLQQKYANKKIAKFKNSKQYKLDDGIFIGTIFEENNKKNGYGIMMYRNRNYYQGEWKDDLKQGMGILVSQEGSFYYGQWKNDLAQGNGLYQQIRNKTGRHNYKGQWKGGLKNGKGAQTLQDGSTYVGDFVNGCKHGVGKLTYPNGTSYQGQFLNNTIQGQGIYKGKNHKYQGSWKQGKMNGTGKSQWYNQKNYTIAKYIGQYKNGIKQGFGQYTDSKGITYKAIWTNGQINQRGPIVTETPKNFE